jgi:hypothetical protein
VRAYPRGDVRQATYESAGTCVPYCREALVHLGEIIEVRGLIRNQILGVTSGHTAKVLPASSGGTELSAIAIETMRMRGVYRFTRRMSPRPSIGILKSAAGIPLLDNRFSYGNRFRL